MQQPTMRSAHVSMTKATWSGVLVAIDKVDGSLCWPSSQHPTWHIAMPEAGAIHSINGARRVWRDVLEDGLARGLHRVERLMRPNAMRARPKRRGKPRDDGERSVIADNILDRDFEADRPNQKWLADFTYIWTAEGWLYVAVVLDLFSRRVVGWSMKADRDASLVMDALMMAVWRRGKTDALLHHSDHIR